MFGLIMILIGCALLWLAWSLRRTARRTTATTTGTVSDIIRPADTRGHVRSTLTYRDGRGMEHRVPMLTPGRMALSEGQQVPVRYDPGKPYLYLVGEGKTPGWLVLAAALFLVPLGLLMLLMGLLALYAQLFPSGGNTGLA